MFISGILIALSKLILVEFLFMSTFLHYALHFTKIALTSEAVYDTSTV